MLWQSDYMSPLVCFGKILSWVTKLRFFWTPSEQIIVWRLLWKLNNAFCQMRSITFALLMLSHHLLSFSAWHCSRRGWVEIKSGPYCNFIFLAFCNRNIDFPGMQINDPCLQKNIDLSHLCHQSPALGLGHISTNLSKHLFPAYGQKLVKGIFGILGTSPI